ncbi:YugN family protein [Psychrobacillus antarcticus]|uniref:YugN family protein n=1 Tax=Psychrobacillus antarcticus TaxID=2879115 RepID=UPI002407E6B5|nr:YugN family protein [Psychrobacillus antarcticus]
MYFENTGIENTIIDLNILDELMKKQGLVRAGQWDYERVTYDKKFMIKEGTFYLRVFGFTRDGDVGAHDANITLLKPVIGKHYYPHGVEYGENEVFPNHLLKSCEQTLAAVRAELATFEIHA